MEAASQEATRFTELVGELYDKNEGYAPGLSDLEKATTDIKLFSAGSDVTIFEFLEKFSAYCARMKKVKAYKLITTTCRRPSRLRVHHSSRTMMNSSGS